MSELTLDIIKNTVDTLNSSRPQYLVESIYYGLYEQWCILAESLLGSIGQEKTKTFIWLQLRKYIANTRRYDGYKLVTFDDISTQQAEKLGLSCKGFWFILRLMTVEEAALKEDDPLKETDFRWVLEIPFPDKYQIENFKRLEC
jgi:hypothetical protein